MGRLTTSPHKKKQTMTNETQKKCAAILAAAQAKVTKHTVVKFTEQPKPEPIPEPEQTKPELSTLTIEDILADTVVAQDAPQEANTDLKIVDYSDKAFAIITATRPPDEVLNILRMYGSYNSRLKCGKGWIFSKRHMAAIKEKLFNQ